MLTRSVSHLAFGKDDVSCLDMPTRHTRTSRGTEASALLRCRGRDGKRLARGAEAACLAARAQPANPRSRRRNWIFLTRTHGQVTSVAARVIGIAVDEIPSEWPIQPISTGLTFTIVP